jgi:hypothetical protein
MAGRRRLDNRVAGRKFDCDAAHPVAHDGSGYAEFNCASHRLSFQARLPLLGLTISSSLPFN